MRTHCKVQTAKVYEMKTRSKNKNMIETHPSVISPKIIYLPIFFIDLYYRKNKKRKIVHQHCSLSMIPLIVFSKNIKVCHFLWTEHFIATKFRRKSQKIVSIISCVKVCGNFMTKSVTVTANFSIFISLSKLLKVHKNVATNQ